MIRGTHARGRPGARAISIKAPLFMNVQNDPQSLALMKFGIGQPVPRTEDPTLVRGEGCYTDDIKLPGEAYAAIVRSRVAHGVIKGIDTAAARAMPGVLGVYTGADLAEYGTLKCIVPFNNRDGTPMIKPPRPALPTDKVRYVGDPIAFVVAETPLQAKDAAEAVEVDIDQLPAVVRPADAAQPGAPLIHAEAPGNVALDYHYGDSEQVDAAFAKAAHVTRLEARQQPRGGERDGAARGDRHLRRRRADATRCTRPPRAWSA